MRISIVAASIALTLAATSTYATLAPRDINGDGITDAFYDTDLNITWLRDAGLSSRSTFSQAGTWANNLVVGNLTGWRLPTSDVSCSAYGSPTGCIKSEMGHLFYTELGSTANHIQTGSFLNVASGTYWSGTSDSLRANQAWTFNASTGFQASESTGLTYSAMAVRNGDVSVSPVPEPETYALLLAGLGLVGSIALRRKAK